MICNNCGERMEGDGYSVVFHCANIDLSGNYPEPDANPVHCGRQWEPMSSAPRSGEVVDLVRGGVVYEGFQWFEGTWCQVTVDQAGPYVTARISKPDGWSRVSGEAK